MTKIMLHVGPHKTGTTAIQLCYFRNRGTLLNNGVCYPVAGKAVTAHHTIVDWLRNWTDKFDPEQLRTELAPYEHAIISSENFVHLSSPQLERARELLSFGEVTVLFYLRRLVDLWPSHWQELIKHGLERSFKSYIADVGLEETTPSDYIRINQMQQVQRLNDVFGPDNVKIIGYDMLREQGLNLATDLLGRIDPALAQLDLSFVDANLSNPGWQTGFLRLFNFLWADRYQSTAPANLRLALTDMIDKDEIPWIEQFREYSVAWDRPVQLRSRAPLVQTLQQQFMDTYGNQIQDDTDAVAAAYFAEKTRIVHDTRFPLQIAPELLDNANALLNQIVEKLRPPAAED